MAAQQSETHDARLTKNLSANGTILLSQDQDTNGPYGYSGGESSDNVIYVQCEQVPQINSMGNATVTSRDEYVLQSEKPREPIWPRPSESNYAVLAQQMKINQQQFAIQTQQITQLMENVNSLTDIVKSTVRVPNGNQSNTAESGVPESDSVYDAVSDNEEEDDDFDSASAVSQTSATMASTSQCVNAKVEKLKKLSKKWDSSEDEGPNINENLASLTTAAIKNNFNIEDGKKLCAKQKVPTNCAAIRVPRINTEMWDDEVLDKQIRMRDCSFQATQEYVGKAMVPLLHLMSSLIDSKSEESIGHFDQAYDCMELLTFAHRDITNVRRKFLKPGLKGQHQQLCKPSTEVTNNLFGDNLGERVKTANEMKKVGKELARPKILKRKRPSESTYPQTPISPKKPYVGQDYYRDSGNYGNKQNHGDFLPRKALPNYSQQQKRYPQQQQKGRAQGRQIKK